MTLTYLEKFVSEGQLGQSDYNLQTLLQKCKGKSFWLWLPGKHDRAMKEVKLGNRYAQIRPPNQCCFNHIIGLPRKNGVEHPLYDYRRIRNMLGADNFTVASLTRRDGITG
jgi:hypothetical protein